MRTEKFGEPLFLGVSVLVAARGGHVSLTATDQNVGLHNFLANAHTKHQIAQTAQPTRITSATRREHTEGHATHTPPGLKTWKSHTNISTKHDILLFFLALV